MDREQLLIAGLTFVAVMSLGAALLVARAERRRRIQERLRSLDMQGSLADTGSTGTVEEKGAGRGLGILARISALFAAGKPSEGLKAQLAKAGFHDTSAAAIFLGAKMLLLIGGTILAAVLVLPLDLPAAQHMALALGSGMLLSFTPNWVVRYIRSRRTEEIRRNLPDAVDLLEICVSAGMGMDMAWNSVGDEVRNVCPRLAEEMALTNLEMHLGANRTVALRHMVDRTGADDLGSLVAVLVQSEKFGTSISDALKVFAASMREARSQRAEEAAEKMAVKLLFPLVLFIFPPVLMVLVGPAAIHLLQFFANG